MSFLHLKENASSIRLVGLTQWINDYKRCKGRIFAPKSTFFLDAAGAKLFHIHSLVGRVIYSATLHLLCLSVLSCLDVVVPSEVQLLLLIIRAQRPEQSGGKNFCCLLITVSVLYSTNPQLLPTYLVEIYSCIGYSYFLH